MDAEAGVPNEVPGDEVVIRVGKIHSVAFIMNIVAKDLVALGFPKMDTVATLRRRHVGVSGNRVLIDDAVIGAAQINSEGVHLDATTAHGCAWRRDHYARIERCEVAPGPSDNQIAYLTIWGVDGQRCAGTIGIYDRTIRAE